MLKEKIDTTSAEVFCEQGILHTVFKKEADVELTDLIEISDAKKAICSGRAQKQLVLADIRNIAYLSHEAKEYGASEESGKNTRALALVTSSLPTRLMANFFISLQRPPYPTKMFTSKEKALEWLRSIPESD